MEDFNGDLCEENNPKQGNSLDYGSELWDPSVITKPFKYHKDK